MADVVTIRAVELVRVGTHEISTGTWIVDRDDLAEAVAAYRAGAVRDPVLKLGHDSPLGDGAPALGRVRNLRTTAGGDVLLGDFVDVPRRLGEVMASAWPSRSVEGWHQYLDSSGRTWRFVVCAVALLGATMPGINDIADVDAAADLFGIAASGRRVVLAASHTAGPTGALDDAARLRAVQVAAARRRRHHRTIGVTP